MLPRAKLRLRLSIAALLSTLIIYTLLPYDNSLVLLIRWHAGNVKYYAKGAFGTHGRHAHAPGTSPVDVSDVGMIIKTGYATRDRLRAKLETLGMGWDVGNVVVAGDYAGEEMLGWVSIEVVDVLRGLLKVEGISGDQNRMEMYKEFRKAVEETPDDVPESVMKMGWELDILKNSIFPPLSSASKTSLLNPGTSSQTTTHTHTHSLLSILSTLSPLKPHYIGNAIGAYTCRFAHGGSGVVFSSAALHTILLSSSNAKTNTKTSKILTQAKINSLTSPFGDLLIAELAIQNGIYVEEEYGLHFNGESPRRTKISEQRACVTLIGFHKMGVEEMEQTRDVFGSVRGMSRVLRWWDTWGTFGKDLSRLKLASGAQTRDVGNEGERGVGGRGSHVNIREAWDYVGTINDQHPRIETANEMACMEFCSKKKGCLAWTWEKYGKKCVLGDWFTVGYEREDAFSGIDVVRVKKLAERCGESG